MIIDRSLVLNVVLGLALFAGAAFLSTGLDNYLLQVGTSLAMLCVLCWAWNLVGGYMGYPALSTAAFFGLGCYGGGFAQVQGLAVMPAWACAAALGAVVAFLLGLPLLRLKGHYFAVGTVAAVEVFREISNNWDAVTGGPIGLSLPFFPGTAAEVGQFFFLAMLALAFIAFALTVWTDRSSFGFALRCIRQNERAASMVGVDVTRFKVAAFVLSGALCATAGAIYASMISYIEPKDAFNIITTIEVPVMVMLGGMGTVFGPLIGAVFYVVLKELVWANFIDWHSAILGAVIVVVVFFLPGGLMGDLRARLMRHLRPGTRPAGAEART